MTIQRLYQAMAIAAAVACTGAAAQMYKCKGPDGKTVYSDTACEAAHTGSAIKVTPMGTTPSEREKAMAEAEEKKAEADRKAEAAARERRDLAKDVADEMSKRGYGGGGAAAAPEPYQLTSADRERIRDLEMQAGSAGAYAEQKRAAQMQAARIRRGADARMSSDDRAHRDSLVTDLSSTDKEKRTRALNELQSKYY
jgi:hypothetical protein